MTEPTFENLKNLILSELESNVDADTVTAEVPLFEGGLGLDSFAVLDLVMAIENTFGVQFTDEDFTVENFANIKAIAELVTRHQKAA